MGSRIKNDVKKLFEFWCEVSPTPGLERGTSSRSGGPAAPAGVIVESFPEGFRDQEVLTGIPSFAFPCDTTRMKDTHIHFCVGQLKPNAEHRRGAAPPARPPPPQSTPASYYNHPYAAHPHVEAKPPRHTSTPTRPRQPLPTADSSSFDSPPDVQSPPIPPRRQGSSNAIVAATAAAVSAEISKLERNCWKDEPIGNDSVRMSNASSSSATSSSSGASFVTAASTFSHLNVSDPPIPTPRAKREQQQPLEDSMNDLISLDDSNNTSFDLEDFDPLNQNARPLPPLSTAFAKKCSTLPAGVNSSVVASSVSNPLYPYFAPKHMATVAAVTGRTPPMHPPPQIQRNTIAAKPDDDFELLRKYGLDQFTLNANGTEKPQQLTTGKGMNNWTTFD
ncbi:GD10102 [Drosophila simulans]|uniref:GD10102 n=1 Tax=Drosophila simulans TaxID=7240 RepID=B4QGS4_DROSI|nr:GD10102 [Drosophila simulans]